TVLQIDVQFCLPHFSASQPAIMAKATPEPGSAMIPSHSASILGNLERMMWVLKKIDAFIGTAVSAVIGLAASQTYAFLAASLRRLGGHLDEAKLAAERTRTGTFPAPLDRSVQLHLQEAADRRVIDLQGAYEALIQADPLLR